MIVTSFFPGRIRLRADVFKNEEIVARAKSILLSSSAVKSIENNVRTGSVLLEYDSASVSVEKLKPLLSTVQDLQSEAEKIPFDKAKIFSMLDKIESELNGL